MKRRNFISGLLSAPLALKARIAQFLVRTRCVEICGAPIFKPRQRDVVQLLAEGKSMKEAVATRRGASFKAPHPARIPLLLCSLPCGHKPPHIWLNPR
jgi:hypothetical protein